LLQKKHTVRSTDAKLIKNKEHTMRIIDEKNQPRKNTNMNQIKYRHKEAESLR
jgi:hypothetical protein